MEITAKLLNADKSTARELTFEYPVPDTLEALTKQFGAEVVVAQAIDAIVIGIQAFVRTKFKAKERLTDKQIVDAINQWKPGTRKAADPAKKKAQILNYLQAMTPEERKAFLKDARSAVKGE